MLRPYTAENKTPDMNDDDFYIGYHGKAPAGTAATMRKVVGALLASGVLVAVLLVISQQPFYPSVWEYLQYRTFEGVLSEQPYPTLRVERPGTAGALPSHSRYYLVNEGKIGVEETVAGLDNQPVRLQGSLIYRDDQTMIELRPGSTVESVAEPSQTTTGSPEGRSLGAFTLQGEIVDSKCFLGVMNPGSLKPHRACAIRCISGGIPPVLAVRAATGETTYLLLVSADGQAVNKDVLGLIAEPVEITGEVVQHENLLTLYADPSTYLRIDP